MPTPEFARAAARRLRVSVILVVRNGEAYLAQALDSVCHSQWPVDEILVIDGHSEDATAAIASRYAQVRYRLQAGSGIAAAYNEGIAAARGHYPTDCPHLPRLV